MRPAAKLWAMEEWEQASLMKGSSIPATFGAGRGPVVGQTQAWPSSTFTSSAGAPTWFWALDPPQAYGHGIVSRDTPGLQHIPGAADPKPRD